MNFLYSYLVIDPENPIYLLLLLLGFIWIITFTVFLGKYFSYKKLNVSKIYEENQQLNREVEDKTNVISNLVSDVHTLERLVEELNAKSSTTERQTELKISMMERVNRTLEEENITLKSRLMSGDTFKDELYKTIVNLFIETRSFFWTGTLESIFLTPLMLLGLSPNDAQLETIEKLSNLKSTYFRNDIVIRDLIKTGVTKWGALEDGLQRGLPIQEITLVVPTKTVTQMQADAFIACSKLEPIEIDDGDVKDV